MTFASRRGVKLSRRRLSESPHARRNRSGVQSALERDVVANTQLSNSISSGACVYCRAVPFSDMTRVTGPLVALR